MINRTITMWGSINIRKINESQKERQKGNNIYFKKI